MVYWHCEFEQKGDSSVIAWRRTREDEGSSEYKEGDGCEKEGEQKTSGVTAVTVRSSNYRVNSGELRPHWWCA